MKTVKVVITAVLLLTATLCTNAQTIDSVQQDLDHIFEHLDKSQIPTGFLDDYGV